MTLRAVVVDDEPLAQQRVRWLLEREPDITLVAECGDAPQALELIVRERPDLLFLDVQMPEMDGFALLRELLPRLPAAAQPVVIFTTAYDQHAVRAFDAHALDYLLKPYKPERFKAALARAREHLAQRRLGQAAQSLRALLDGAALSAGGADALVGTQGSADNSSRGVTGTGTGAGDGAASAAQAPATNAAPGPYLKRLTVRDAGKVHVLDVEQIDCVESAGNYVGVQVGRQTHIVRETLQALEGQLDPSHFVRISRGVIINLARLAELQATAHGGHVAVMRDGRRLPTTRALKELEQRLRYG